MMVAVLVKKIVSMHMVVQHFRLVVGMDNVLIT
jgi:hypothetical protein